MAKKKPLDFEEEEVAEEPVAEEEAIEEPVVVEAEKPVKASKKVKAKVIRAYSDKNDGTVHRPGETVEVTEKRFNEINSKKEHIRKA